MKHKIADTAREAAAKVKTAAGQTVARAKDQAEHFAADKREAAADRIGGYSSAIHESARALEENDPNIAWFTHQAADKLEGMAEYVRTRDFAGLREDCSSLARRHRLAYFGGMFMAGLVLGNFLKASPRRLEGSDGSGDYQGSPDYASAENGTPEDMTLSDRTPASTWGGA